ncbi:hypothetical protein A8C32_02635 [Flavivirga aquatica]|uniref:Uncharacterized protein n=1 Tax=Flavivirga aquatica TaxID=1849968 RepID=A0A1E5TAK5_9FLAO|nr:hypothetical protein [Flavivirga aquatica]OEK08366.1 hypothetical protein A8C32_02635 [Flavivirga aquatica]
MKKRPKKTFKIIIGSIIFITLPSLLFFTFLYFKYNEELPYGVKGEKADILAHKMLDALNYEAFKNTDYIEWTFKKRHHYRWNKANNSCEVYWKEYRVKLDLNDNTQSKAYIHSFNTDGEIQTELINKALKYFNNDSFWLVAPYKVFDDGVERRLVTLENNEEALLVTHTTGGTTPGDSYLWLLDKSNKPKAFKMWTSLLPIDGIEASWANWITTESGAQLPNFHKLIFFALDIDEIKGTE